MATLPIITVPDPKLRETSVAVERVDADLIKLADDMLETMYAAPGIGLAAIQLGIPRRLFVADVAREGEDPAPYVMINPEIVWRSDEPSTYNEGCLSIPDQYAEIERPARVRMAYLDRQGKSQEIEADGVLATCIQHEYDHLDGVLFIDYLSRLKRQMIIKKVKKAQKDAGPIL